MSRKGKRLPVVLIRWIDTTGSRGWRDAEAWDKWLSSDGAAQETVGFLLKRTKKYIAVVQSVQQCDDPNMDAILQIPAGVILSVRRLQGG